MNTAPMSTQPRTKRLGGGRAQVQPTLGVPALEDGTVVRYTDGRGDRAVPLSQEQTNRLTKALTDKTALRTCAACGSSQFELQPEIGQIRLGPGLGPRMIPVAVVICANCGNTRTHALHQLGLMDLAGEALGRVFE
jgi:hypothetical protein